MQHDTMQTQEMKAALGQSVVACWSLLPHDIQKLLFERAAGDRRRDGFRAALALFLHDHHPRTADPGPD